MFPKWYSATMGWIAHIISFFFFCFKGVNQLSQLGQYWDKSVDKYLRSYLSTGLAGLTDLYMRGPWNLYYLLHTISFAKLWRCSGSKILGFTYFEQDDER